MSKISKITSKITDLPKQIWSSQTRRFNLFVFLSILVLSLLVILPSIIFATIYYALVFLQANVLHVIVLSIAGLSVFYLSYQTFVKKSPGYAVTSAYVVLLALYMFSVISVSSLLQFLAGEPVFSISNYIVIYFVLILTSIVISRYDIRIVTGVKQLYLVCTDHIRSNIGIWLALSMVIAILGFQNQIYLYGIVVVWSMVISYLIKVLLSNLRK
ncbi:MAG: hypothetical protein ACOCXT_03435 [Candidatus Dojkabacteria bacterium]